MEKNNKKIDINYKYFLHYVRSQDNYKNIKVLDYGCGKGEILQLLLDNGINTYGVDVYHQGPSEDVLNSELYKSGKIKIIEVNKNLPFEDKSFDLIVSNQVFEHVSDIDFAVSELNRILKDDGKMYHHFPSSEVWREGHIGIPFAHWFGKKSKSRYFYTYLFRALGLGHNKKNRSIKEWTDHSLNYIDNFCYYRDVDELITSFAKFDIRHKEIDYINFRISSRAVFKKMLGTKIMTKIYEKIFRKSAFMCIELKKK